jgi:hypothetical protein
MFKSAALIGLITLICSFTTQASTVFIEPSADTVLLSSDTATNQGSTTTLSLNPQTDTERSLIKFDLSNLTLNPSDLQSATLEVSINYKSTDWSNRGNATELSLHRVTEEWEESGATWDCSTASCSVVWDGGSYNTSATDRVKIAKISSGTIQLDVTSDLVDMLVDNNEFGWLLKKSREDKNGSIVFSSKEGIAAPRLILTVTDGAPDIAPPNIVITAPNTSLVISDTPPVITVNFSDDQGISSANLYLDGLSINSDCTISTAFANCSLPDLGEGVHNLEVFVDDTAGKQSSDNLEFLYLKGGVSGAGFASKWHASPGIPAETLGKDSDLYLDIDTADVYQKQAGFWNWVLNIKGEPGIPGQDGLDGVDGIDGAKGDKGDKGDIGPGGPVGPGGLIGPEGPTGPTGPSGSGGKGGTGQPLLPGAVVFFTLAKCPSGYTQISSPLPGLIACKAGVPTAPSNLTALGGTEQIKLTWAAPADDGGSPITEYRIYRSIFANDGVAVVIATTNGLTTEYIDLTSVIGVKYFYRVTAVSTIDESEPTNEASAVAVIASTTIILAGDVVSYNFFEAIGSPTEVADYRLIVPTGVTIGSLSPNLPSLDSGNLPIGSTFTLINNGKIYGAGGNGGNGGFARIERCIAYVGNGSDGSKGGDAVVLRVKATIDNTNGTIFSGGGGGKGGFGYTIVGNATYIGGGGGGGGQGYVSGKGGTGGWAYYLGCKEGLPRDSIQSADGAEGTLSERGLARSTGGHGGLLGQPAMEMSYITLGSGSVKGVRGQAGAPGIAVAANGHLLIWQGGNNTTQVKGPIEP